MRSIASGKKWMTALVAVAIVASATSVNASSQNPEFYTDLLLSDLIVRGHIRSAWTKLVAAHELDPSWSADSGYLSVTFVDIDVDEVIRGIWDKPALTFAVIEASDTHFLISRHLTNNSTVPADEVVAGLLFMPGFRGGGYKLQMSDALFIRAGNLWAREGAAQAAVPLDEIHDVVKPTMFSSVVATSQTVAIASVSSFRPKELADPGDKNSLSTVLILEANVTKVLKGSVDLGGHTIRCFVAGSYYPPSWAGHGPLHIDTGVDYCMFLTEVDGQLTIIGGANGMYRVGDDGKLQHNELPLDVTVPDLQKMIAK